MSEEIENICLADAWIEENRLYAARFEQNMLIEYDMETLETKFLGNLCFCKKLG